MRVFQRPTKRISAMNVVTTQRYFKSVMVRSCFLQSSLRYSSVLMFMLFPPSNGFDAVQGHSGVSYEVGYLAQTILNIASAAEAGGITVQMLSLISE